MACFISFMLCLHDTVDRHFKLVKVMGINIYIDDCASFFIRGEVQFKPKISYYQVFRENRFRESI